MLQCFILGFSILLTINNQNQIKMKKNTLNIAVLIALLLTSIGAFAQVPTITSFAPASGPVGTSVTITGTNFNTSFANNIVFFGATQATVSAGSNTSLTVTVATGASYQSISVTDIITGLTAYSAQPFITTFACGGFIDATSFAGKEDFSAGDSPFSISTGDFDGDGKTDLAVANANFNTVSVFQNTGSSGTVSFAAKVDFATGTSPQGTSTGDFDGDGKIDLAVANNGSATVSIFRNTGSSGTISFDTKVDFTTGTGPRSVSTGDFDGDGKTDLAVTNYNSDSISVFRNTGSGTISFATKVDYITGASPISVSTGDFDGDGKPDLAVANWNSNTVSVFRNTGSSGTISFADTVNFITGAGPYSASAGDLDGDGKSDLAVANSGSNTISVFRNTGSSGIISFADTVEFTTGAYPVSVSTGDLDGDGNADLAVANYGSNTVSVFRNTGSSGTISFAATVDFTTGQGPWSVSTGDLDGDGKTDLAVANQGFNSVSVLRNTIFTPSVTVNATATSVCTGASITLTEGGTADTYTWTGGVTNGVGFVPLIGTTTYTVTGTTTSTGCQNTATITITVDTLPTVTANATATTVCAGESITLTGSGTADSYNWTNGESDGIGFIPPTGTTIYTVTGTVTATGCQNTATATITVDSLPIVTINATATTVCTDTSITLTEGGTADIYTWTGGVMNGVVFVPPTGTNTYTVTGTITATGCQNSATETITVNPLPTVTANATATTVCAGASITLTGGQADTYNWTGGITDGIGFVPLAGTTTYTVTGTITATGCQDTATTTITVDSLPAPTVTANATATTVCAGASITLTGGGADTYNWTGGVTDGVGFVPLTGTTTYTVTGTDTVTGCQNTATDTITVNPLPTVTLVLNSDPVCINTSAYPLTGGLPSGGTYSGAGVSAGNFNPSVAGNGLHTITYSYTDGNCMNTSTAQIFVDFCTGVQYFSAAHPISIYPNPFSDMTTVLFNTTFTRAEVNIFDMIGKEVMRSVIPSGARSFTIQRGDLQNGIYFIKVISEGTIIKTEKLVIQ